ncbi:Photosystem II reaction center Psb28 protein [Rhynchospora pubera]|uniref:Photosystem II reaction center Psb28 protein n=1 Tax=Rhynchospora pubera TaxID=906938 RepID=A0AAV8HAG5_9POAL|nr:Photosystem II reaction center Psb28 protein [Rhynchospora pubera]
MATLRCVSLSSHLSRPRHLVSGMASPHHRFASPKLHSSFAGTSLRLSTERPHAYTKTRAAPSITKVQMVAKIQFIQGTDEQTIPDVKLTKSRDGTNGVAIFTFDEPSLFDSSGELGDITGFYMIDDEGVIQSVDVSAKFVNGKPSTIEAKHVMRTPRDWDRFMRFMERYSQANGLQFVKK